MIRQPPRSTLFPYPPLFRSRARRLDLERGPASTGVWRSARHGVAGLAQAATGTVRRRRGLPSLAVHRDSQCLGPCRLDDRGPAARAALTERLVRRRLAALSDRNCWLTSAAGQSFPPARGCAAPPVRRNARRLP